MGCEVEFWAKIRFALQRYDEHLPFCKFFGKKSSKKCIFFVLGLKNDDLVE
jgi:hypothetical protein